MEWNNKKLLEKWAQCFLHSCCSWWINAMLCSRTLMTQCCSGALSTQPATPLTLSVTAAHCVRVFSRALTRFDGVFGLGGSICPSDPLGLGNAQFAVGGA